MPVDTTNLDIHSRLVLRVHVAGFVEVDLMWVVAGLFVVYFALGPIKALFNPG